MDSDLESSPLCILVVEDEPRYLESTRMILTYYGHHVVTAANGAQARAALMSLRYDIVLLDLHLPDDTGLRILQDLREQLSASMVIVVSGDASLDSAVQALKCGAYDFLRKPYEPEVLFKTLRNAARALTLKRENKAYQQRLAQSEQWHRFLVNNSPDLIYTLDAQGHFSYLNDSIERLTGYGATDLLGKGWQEIVATDGMEPARWRLNERRTGDRATHNEELRLRRRPLQAPGAEPAADVVVELTAMGMYQADESGTARFLGTYGVARDITARKQAEATITFQAYHDLLTGLPNRALFNDRLGQAIANARRHGILMAVMFLDLDRFKMVNDTLGHLVGDELLQVTSQRLRHCLREGDTLARIGGDEFMLLLPQIRTRENTAHIARKALDALEAPFRINGHELFISASIGIAIFPDDGDNQEILIKHADIAMYAAKDRGRNDFRFFDSDLNNSLSGRLLVESEMRRALQRGEFDVYYQPQVNIASGAIIGLEALARWNHPSNGLMQPDHFIPIAEDTGLIAPISEWVLRSTCQQTRQWRALSLRPATVAVNLSTRQIERPNFVEHFSNILQEYQLDGQGIEIEITESTLMRDMEGAIGKLKRLSDMGVQISIDDFGTGYSSLAYLKKLPVHSLKIDRSFIHDLQSHSNGGSIVAGIAAMAKGLHLNIVAEGVETQAQLDYLRAVGCDAYQGFLFSQAVNAQDATQLLQASIGRPALLQ